MPDYTRVATFEADEAGLEAVLNEINSSGGAPADVPAKRLTVLANRSTGQIVIAVRFGSEEDLKKGSEAFEAMSPPAGAGSMRRISVEVYEVVLERDA